MSLPESRTVFGDCGHRFRAQVWRSVNTSDPALVERFLDGSLNIVQCPACGQETEVRSPFLFHDVKRRLMVFIYDPDHGDADPIPALDPRLRQAMAATGELISADSFGAVREAIREFNDPELLPRLRQQHPGLSDAKLSADFIRDCVENSSFNVAMRALRELENEVQDAQPESPAVRIDGLLVEGHFLIGSPCNRCRGVFERDDRIALVPVGRGYEAIHTRHLDSQIPTYEALLKEAEKRFSDNDGECNEEIDATADDDYSASESAVWEGAEAAGQKTPSQNVFDRLSRWMDGAAVQMRVGRIVKKCAFQLQREVPALSTKDAEALAMQECLASIRAEGIDMNSFSDIKSWSKRFLKQR